MKPTILAPIVLCLVYGLLLIVYKDLALPQAIRGNSITDTLYKYNFITGLIFCGSSYFLYMKYNKPVVEFTDFQPSATNSMTQEVSLPSYTEATSNSDLRRN